MGENEKDYTMLAGIRKTLRVKKMKNDGLVTPGTY